MSGRPILSVTEAGERLHASLTEEFDKPMGALVPSDSGLVNGLQLELSIADIPQDMKQAIAAFVQQGQVRIAVATLVRRFLMDIGAHTT